MTWMFGVQSAERKQHSDYGGFAGSVMQYFIWKHLSTCSRILANLYSIANVRIRWIRFVASGNLWQTSTFHLTSSFMITYRSIAVCVCVYMYTCGIWNQKSRAALLETQFSPLFFSSFEMWQDPWFFCWPFWWVSAISYPQTAYWYCSNLWL